MLLVDESPGRAAATAVSLREGWAQERYLVALDMAMRGDWELAENYAKTAASVASVVHETHLALLIVSLRRLGLAHRAELIATSPPHCAVARLTEAERFEAFLRKQGV